MRHAFETMGTVASVELPQPTRALLDALEAVFSRAEARFSLYRPESELSRVAAGSLALPHASIELRSTYAKALEWRNRTDGAFTPNRPDGVIDLNGIVKAEAIAAAGELLTAAGCRGWSLAVGGDILVSGSRPDDSPWVVGVLDPDDRAALLCSVLVEGSRRAVATSGSAERGDHVWLGGSTAPAAYVQATVVADDIVTADVLATAIIAGGRAALDDTTARWPVDVLTVDREGTLLATPGFRAALTV